MGRGGSNGVTQTHTACWHRLYLFSNKGQLLASSHLSDNTAITIIQKYRSIRHIQYIIEYPSLTDSSTCIQHYDLSEVRTST